MTTAEPEYGWYSRKQATETGTLLVYRSADGNCERSRLAYCTEVTPTPDAPPLKWDDLVFVGRLGNFECQAIPVF